MNRMYKALSAAAVFLLLLTACSADLADAPAAGGATDRPAATVSASPASTTAPGDSASTSTPAASSAPSVSASSAATTATTATAAASATRATDAAPARNIQALLKPGDSLQALLDTFGQPDDICASIYNFRWYVYAGNYKDFLMVAVRDGSVFGWYQEGASLNYRGLVDGSDKAQAGAVMGSQPGGNEQAYSVDGMKIILYFDGLNGGVLYGLLTVRELTVASYAADALAGESRVMYHLVNARRAAHGAAPLTWCAKAAAAALLHSADMAENDYFDHTGLNGSSSKRRMNNAGVSGNYYGENIAAGYYNAFNASNGLFNSAGHRVNMLDIRATHMGAGIVYNADRAFRLYYTQNLYRKK